MKLLIQPTARGFVSRNEKGYAWNIAGKEGNELDARPMELLLSGIAGCVALDVKAILQKQRVDIKHWEIATEGKRLAEIPAAFELVILAFSFNQPASDIDKLIRAVELSATKYCSAIFSLHPSIKITVEIVNHNHIIHEFSFTNTRNS